MSKMGGEKMEDERFVGCCKGELRNEAQK